MALFPDSTTMKFSTAVCITAVFSAVISAGIAERTADAQDSSAPRSLIIESGESNALERLAKWLRDPESKGVLSVGHGTGPLDAAPVLVLLTNDDRLSGASVSLKDDRIAISREADDAAPIRVDVENVRGIVIGETLSADERALLLRRLESHRFEDDVLLLEGRDRLIGEIQKITDGQVELKAAGGTVEVALSRVRGIAFSRDLWSVPKTDLDRALVVSNDGSILSGKSVSVKEHDLTIEWVAGSPVPFPFPAVRWLTILGADVVPLSAEPEAVDYQPFLPGSLDGEADLNQTTVRINRSIRGGLLTLNRRIFPRGLGVTSGTSLSYSIPENMARFVATVGIDDEAGTDGSAVFRILVDGEERWSSGLLAGESPAKRADVDIREGKRLTLAVDYGPDGDVRDVADWCEPVFLKSSILSSRDVGP